MASRRAVASPGQTISFPPSTITAASSSAPEKLSPHTILPSDTSPLVPASTIYKLVIFTIAMFTLPLLSYFASLDLLFGGNSSYAGGLAALMANVVLGGYVIAAVREDAGDRLAESKKEE